jgi:hypothetical protein
MESLPDKKKKNSTELKDFIILLKEIYCFPRISLPSGHLIVIGSWTIYYCLINV